MGAFRRPELEKDNPTAPQAYIGPRRRLALARAAEAAAQKQETPAPTAARPRRTGRRARVRPES